MSSRYPPRTTAEVALQQVGVVKSQGVCPQLDGPRLPPPAKERGFGLCDPAKAPAGPELAGDLLDRRLDDGELTLAAAVEDEPTAGSGDAGEVREEGVVILDPVECGDAHDGVDRLDGDGSGEVGDDEICTITQPGTALLDHVHRRIDAHEIDAGVALDQGGGVAPRAAPRVQHPTIVDGTTKSFRRRRCCALQFPGD